jgi:hypothetical protein
MRKKDVLAVILLSIVVLSGCITQGREKGPPKVGGIPTVSFTVDSRSIPAGSIVGAIVSIDNKALVEMNVLDVDWIDLSGWSEAQGPSETSGIIQPQFGQDYIFLLESPKSTREGGPLLVDTPYTLYATVKYSMTVRKALTARVVQYDYYKRTGTKSNIEPSEIDPGGPVKIEFLIGDVPYVYGTTTPTIPIRVVLTNVGGGKTYYGGEPKITGGLNKLKVTTGSELTCSPTGEITLTKGGTEAYLYCTLNVGTMTGDIQVVTTWIQLEFNYVHDLVSPQIVVTVPPTITTVTCTPGAPTCDPPCDTYNATSDNCYNSTDATVPPCPAICPAGCTLNTTSDQCE